MHKYNTDIAKNIYLYHLVKDDFYFSVVPWKYADGKRYLGGTWWEQDNEILDNLKKLSIVDFYKKYKGY